MEAGRDINLTVLDTIYGVWATCSKVTPATIKNCFSYCVFVAPASSSTPEDEDDDPHDDTPLGELIQSLWHAGMEVSAGDAEDEAVYQTVDDNLLISAP